MSVEKYRLKVNHTWKSKPGYSICVLDRGEVRFDYPSHWIVEPGEGAAHLHDREPSVESCDLGTSLFRLPAEVTPGSWPVSQTKLLNRIVVPACLTRTDRYVAVLHCELPDVGGHHQSVSVSSLLRLFGPVLTLAFIRNPIGLRPLHDFASRRCRATFSFGARNDYLFT